MELALLMDSSFMLTPKEGIYHFQKTAFFSFTLSTNAEGVLCYNGRPLEVRGPGSYADVTNPNTAYPVCLEVVSPTCLNWKLGAMEMPAVRASCVGVVKVGLANAVKGIMALPKGLNNVTKNNVGVPQLLFANRMWSQFLPTLPSPSPAQIRLVETLPLELGPDDYYVGFGKGKAILACPISTEGWRRRK